MRVYLSEASAWHQLEIAGRTAQTWMNLALEKLGALSIQPFSDYASADPSQLVLIVEGVFPLLGLNFFEQIKAHIRRNHNVLVQVENYPASMLHVFSPGNAPEPGLSLEALRKLSQASSFITELSQDFHPLEKGEDFAQLSATFYATHAKAAMRNGAFLQAPAQTWIDAEVEIAAGCSIGPNVQLSGKTKLGPACRIGIGALLRDAILGEKVEVKAYSVIEGSSIGNEAQIGPFAHIRPDCQLGAHTKVGNFVETKKISMGDGSKASHLAYLGDASIGADCNIGAGTITCNYDGFQKHRTQIGDRVFIGSDSQLVAPVALGDDVFVAAGSTVTKSVASGALAISRVRQENLEGRALKLRERAARASNK